MLHCVGVGLYGSRDDAGSQGSAPGLKAAKWATGSDEGTGVVREWLKLK